jgi:hypothetical protein
LALAWTGPGRFMTWRSECRALARASREDIEAFARSARHGWPGRFAGRVQQAMAAPRLAPPPALARAKEGSIRLAAAQLLAIRAQRRQWERRMGELLPGAPRYGRSKTPKDPDPGKAFPGGEIYLSMPGLGDRLAARVAGEIGEHFGQFTTPNALQCYAGRAPVTRRSGRSEFTIARRLACNRHLGEAVQQWAFCSLARSGPRPPCTANHASTSTSTAPTAPPARPGPSAPPPRPCTASAHAAPVTAAFPRPGSTPSWPPPRSTSSAYCRPACHLGMEHLPRE